MASEEYGFFQGATGDERDYDSGNMATAFLLLASTGVRMMGSNLQVTAEGGSMRTVVGYGYAMISGRYYNLYDDGSGAKMFTHTTSGGLNRIDRIVVRLNLSARTITVNKIIGVAGAEAEAPALTRTGEIYEISLAQVAVNAGASELTADDITDERDDDTVCGLIAPESLRPSSVQAMIDATVAAAVATVLRYTAQTLEAGQKDTARANIDAQQKITAAAGLLKTDGSGGTAKAELNTDYAQAVVEIAATLTAAGWTSAEAPYSQDVAIAGMTDAKKIEVGLANTATDAQYTEAVDAQLRAVAQGTGFITIRAHGDKPVGDIPILIRIVG